MQGDFNLHHTRWQPSWQRSPTPGVDTFVEWLDDKLFSLISPLDKATHNRGNVLDLALSSGSLQELSRCVVASHLDATSDHLPLLTTIGWERYPEEKQKLRPDTIDNVIFQNLLSIACKGITPLPTSLTAESLDKLAEDLTETIRTAYT